MPYKKRTPRRQVRKAPVVRRRAPICTPIKRRRTRRAAIARPNTVNAAAFALSQKNALTSLPMQVPDGGCLKTLAYKSIASHTEDSDGSGDTIVIAFAPCPQWPSWHQKGGTSPFVGIDMDPGSGKVILESCSQYRVTGGEWELKFIGNNDNNEGSVKVVRLPMERALSGVGENANSPSILEMMNAIRADDSVFDGSSDTKMYSVAEIAGGLHGNFLHTKSAYDFDGGFEQVSASSGLRPAVLSDSQWTITFIKVTGCAASAAFESKVGVNVEQISNQINSDGGILTQYGQFGKTSPNNNSTALAISSHAMNASVGSPSQIGASGAVGAMVSGGGFMEGLQTAAGTGYSVYQAGRYGLGLFSAYGG